MKLIIDRFEGKYAICEDENCNMINILKEELPSNVKVGDVIIKVNNDFVVDYDETKKRKKYISFFPLFISIVVIQFLLFQLLFVKLFELVYNNLLLVLS